VDERIVGASEVVRDARVSPIVASPAAVSKRPRKTERKFTKATPTPNTLPNAHGLWLDPTVSDVQPVQTLLTPYPAGEMTAHPVSTRLINPAYDSPECTAPSR
jgi:hypothetical protein